MQGFGDLSDIHIFALLAQKIRCKIGDSIYFFTLYKMTNKLVKMEENALKINHFYSYLTESKYILYFIKKIIG